MRNELDQATRQDIVDMVDLLDKCYIWINSGYSTVSATSVRSVLFKIQTILKPMAKSSSHKDY